jgi:Ca2+/H+ antiporter, TMEM165/GDT1 family
LGNEPAPLSFGYLVLMAFWTVLVAELVGDKTIYTVSSLALRFRPLIVLVSLVLAFALKMFVAVLLGKFVIQFNSRWTDLISACAFFLSAALIWFEEKEVRPDERPASVHWSRAALVSFGSLFFTEWGDPGQISAAALVLKSHSAWPIWLGGTCGMVTKGILAMTVGVKLAERLPRRTLRTVASASCGVLGVVALGGFVLR